MNYGKPLLSEEMSIQYHCPEDGKQYAVEHDYVVGRKAEAESGMPPIISGNANFAARAARIGDYAAAKKRLGWFTLHARIEGGCDTCETAVAYIEIQCPGCGQEHEMSQ